MLAGTQLVMSGVHIISGVTDLQCEGLGSKDPDEDVELRRLIMSSFYSLHIILKIFPHCGPPVSSGCV